MGKINRKAVNAKKNKDQPGKAKGSASAAAGSEKAKKSKESGGGVVLLGVKKKSATVKSAKLRKKDRVRVKKQHLLLKLQGGNSVDKNTTEIFLKNPLQWQKLEILADTNYGFISSSLMQNAILKWIELM